MEQKNFQQNKPNTTNNIRVINRTRKYIFIPCTQGLYESIKNVCGKYGTQTYFKDNRTLKNILVTPKDMEHIQK